MAPRSAGERPRRSVGDAIEAETLSLALLCALERLNPVQRAVLVLRDVFDVEYAEIADILDNSPANARQIAKRARDHAGDATRRRAVDPQERRRLTVAFLLATQRGDVDQLRAILAADAIQYSDGGGNVIVARKPIYGADKIARFYANVRRTGRLPADLSAEPVLVNGDPGVRLVSASGGAYAITALELADDQVLAIRNFVNPERFARFHRSLS